MKKKFTLILLTSLGNMFAQVSSQAFTVSGNFVVPPGVTTVTVDVIGAGGNGASNGGGGGGGGGAARGVYAVTPGASIPVMVGTAGGGSVTSISSFSNIIFATGGMNGSTVANPSIGGGGMGGFGYGGSSNWTGGNGGGGYYTYFGGGGGGAAGPSANGGAGGNTITWTGVCLTPGGTGGVSGGGLAGAGGKGAGFTDPNCNVTDPSANGANYGAGGGGGNGNGGAPGVGANGYCEVFYNACAVPPAPVNITPPANQLICQGNTTTLSATSTGTVNWYSGPNAPTPIGTGANFTVAPNVTTTYYAETNTCNTSTRVAVTVAVNPSPTVTVLSNKPATCPMWTATLTASGASSYTWNTSANTSTLLIFPAATTNYTVTGSGSNNCTGTATISQLVFPSPSLTITSSSGTICIGQSASLTVSGAVTYSWNTGATGSVLAVSPTINTLYWVTGTSGDDCEDTITIRQYVKTCATGFASNELNKTDFDVYPNPGRGAITISASQNLNLSVLDQLGRTVEIVTLNEHNGHRVTLTNLLPGVYLVVGVTPDITIHRKIIISD